MWQRNYLPIFFVGMLVSCESDVKSETRKGRLFTFNTVNEDIRVDLDFSIPFISIPVKQTMETAFGLGIPSVNVNMPALVLGGAVVLGSTILLPLLVKSFASSPPYQRYAKSKTICAMIMLVFIVLFVEWRAQKGRMFVS